jgi:hypothetical protein
MAHSKATVKQIMDLHAEGMSNRKIAKKVLGRSGAKSSIADILERERIRRTLSVPVKEGAKILHFDVETAPARVYVWGRFMQNIGQSQVVSEHFILTWAAKWLGEDKVKWDA